MEESQTSAKLESKNKCPSCLLKHYLIVVCLIFRRYLIRLTEFIINQTELYNDSEVISYFVIVT